jgi:hypothetical protein
MNLSQDHFIPPDQATSLKPTGFTSPRFVAIRRQSAGMPRQTSQTALACACNLLLFKDICFSLTLHANSLSRKEKSHFFA